MTCRYLTEQKPSGLRFLTLRSEVRGRPNNNARCEKRIQLVLQDGQAAMVQNVLGNGAGLRPHHHPSAGDPTE